MTVDEKHLPGTQHDVRSMGDGLGRGSEVRDGQQGQQIPAQRSTENATDHDVRSEAGADGGRHGTRAVPAIRLAAIAHSRGIRVLHRARRQLYDGLQGHCVHCLYRHSFASRDAGTPALPALQIKQQVRHSVRLAVREERDGRARREYDGPGFAE
jgi:hypothetical protein